MISRNLSFVFFGLCLLTGCAAEQQLAQDASQAQPVTGKDGAKKQEPNEQQKSVEAKYTQAVNKWQKKMQPISEYMVNVCRPKQDKKYIKCITEKNDAIIEASYQPDLTIKMLNARKEFEQKLIAKKISRKEFLEHAEKLQNEMLNQINERTQQDIKAGTYSAKY